MSSCNDCGHFAGCVVSSIRCCPDDCVVIDQTEHYDLSPSL